jgi:hypothetical protein
VPTSLHNLQYAGPGGIQRKDEIMKRLALATLASLGLLSVTAYAGDDGKPADGGIVNGRALGMLLYRAAGARNYPGNTASSVSCSNFTATSQKVQYIFRNFDFAGTAAYNITMTIPANSNKTYSTVNTAWLAEDVYGDGINVLNEGTLLIRGTAKDIHCSAWNGDVSALTPAGATPLHLVRFNAAAGSQE